MSAVLAPARGAAPCRVMLVDDSAVIRGILARALEGDPAIEIAASAANGQIAIDTVKRGDIDIVLLDVAMPVMDGLTALPLLLRAKPDLKVIIVSSLTKSGAAVTMKALSAGAVDYVTKPTTSAEAGETFRRELVAKVKALAEARQPRRGAVPLRPIAPASAPGARTLPAEPPKAIAIASSTGGPMALYRFAAALKRAVVQPIFITQHMPPTFTAIFADHLSRGSGLAAAEARDGEMVAERRVYVAPGDHHMLVESVDGGKRISLGKGLPENFCRPAADPMLRSLATAYGRDLLTVVLTGMGHDGLAGSRAAVAAGGAVIAQDQATSVVWGMPGAVANAGLCAAILPLDEIGPLVLKLATRGRA